MVPAAVVVLDEVPLTPVGKLDRRALPEPVFEQAVFRAPSTPLEEAVATVFEQVLGARRIGLDDDFFSLGGTSLLATQVVERLRMRTGAELTMASFFTDPTVAGIAAQVAAALEAGHDYDANAESALRVLLPIRAGGTVRRCSACRRCRACRGPTRAWPGSCPPTSRSTDSSRPR
uniref:phosphopantetheine-binding protein n=1 Tax=Nocardia xishanensis TaxID=238964 RepID=UPI00082BE0AF|nr:phosphopantetheine-binding protein [Nocardia xishanensis]